MTLEQMLNRTIVYHKEIDEKIREAMKVATEAAIKAAADATPPLGESNRTTGNVKKHWEEDSVTEAVKEGNVYKTVLANNVPYASYVNDGHNLEKHYGRKQQQHISGQVRNQPEPARRTGQNGPCDWPR